MALLPPLPLSPASLRRSGLLDRLVAEAGQALHVLAGAVTAGRPNPADALDTPAPSPAAATDTDSASPAALDPAETRHAAGLMRVNHVGEICAQALYRGQSLFTESADTRALLMKASSEEVDHLAWLNQRLDELGSRPSLLNPLWYAGAFTLGVIASRAGEPYNLGFMAETEKQVEEHLEGHLETLPERDTRSREIVRQMQIDEAHHRQVAEDHGAAELPAPIKLAMRAMSKVMTTTAYRI